jgi:hypothetical protein
MSLRQVSIVWAIAVAVGLLAWLNLQTSSTQGLVDALVLAESPAPADVRGISLRRPDGTFRFERDVLGNWWQTEPFRHRMDTAQLMLIPETLQRLRTVARVELKSGQGDVLGLPDPDSGAKSLATLRLDREGGPSIDIELGRKGIGGRGWLRLGSTGDVLVVDDDLHQLVLQEAPQTWRDPRLFGGIGPDTTTLAREIGGERVELARVGRRWQFLSPVQTRADAEALGAWMSELAGARFSAVLLDQPPDPRAFGLEPPFAKVLVADGSNASTSLLIGDRVSGATADRYAMIEGVPSVVRIDGDTVLSLLADPIQLIDRTGSGIDAADIDSVRILTADGTVLIERALDGWTFSDGGALNTASMAQLLHVLLDEPAIDVTMVDVYPEELQVASIVLQGRGGRPLDTIRVLREPLTAQGPGRLGMENGDGVIRVLPKGVALPLTKIELSR